MGDFIKTLKDTPIPTILVWAGLFFLLLPFVSKIGGVIEVQPNQKRSAIFIGLLLLTIGLTLNLTPTILSSSQPTILSSSQPTILSSSQPSIPSPIQFVRDYYTIVNAKELDKAWGMLTPEFQNQDKKSGYSGFSDWWKSVDQVQVQEISLLSQSNDTAKVDVQIAYVIGDNFKKERPQRFTLIWNSRIRSWQINDREKL
jgi:hypothetical protein